MMKHTLSPDHEARLQQIVDDLDALYRDLSDPRTDISSFEMGKISAATGDLFFVLDRMRRSRPVSEQDVRLVTLS